MRQRAVSDFFAVGQVMNIPLNGGKAVVNRMGARQTAVFKTQPGKQRIGFHHRLHRGRDLAHRNRLGFHVGRQAIGDARGKQSHRRLGADGGIHQHQFRIFSVKR